MIRFFYYCMLSTVILQAVSLTLVGVLVGRYKVTTVQHSLGFHFFWLLTSFTSFLYFVELHFFSGWTSQMFSITLLFHCIAIYGMSIFCSLLIRSYVAVQNNIMTVIAILVCPLSAAGLYFAGNTTDISGFFTKLFYILCMTFFIFLLIFVILLTISLIRKTVQRTRYSIAAITIILIYLPVGVIDCFWPLFPRIHAFLRGFSLSHGIVIAASVCTVIFSFPFIVYHDGKMKNCNNFINHYSLTHREAEILKLVLKGETNHKIALRLDISYSTVKKHVYSIFQKTGAKSRIELLTQFGSA